MNRAPTPSASGGVRHELMAERPTLHGRFSMHAAPVLTVDPGDSVTLRGIPDVGWGLASPTSTLLPRRKVEPRDARRDAGPCLCGPVAVRGAEPGDTLEIALETVRPGAWGWTYAAGEMASPAWNTALGVAGEPLALQRWTLDRERSRAVDEAGNAVPMRPFPGSIGLAPAEDDACGFTPRRTGGNLDCRELVAGTSLFLPVAVAGGLLSIGDGHAAQGDGEVAGTAIECMLEEISVRVVLHRGMRVQSPRVRGQNTWITLGFGPSLDEAAREAMCAMLDLLMDRWNVPRSTALARASACVHLRVTQIVNPLVGVHAVLDDSAAAPAR